MKKTLIALLFLNSLILFSQNIELIGGGSYNSFFEFHKDEGHYITSYQPEWGCMFKVAIDDIKFEEQGLRFTLGYVNYGGKINAYNGGLGGGSRTLADVNKSVLSLGIYPFNFKILKRIDFNLGVEVSGLLHETFSGIIYSWTMGESTSIVLEERYEKYSTSFYIGLQARLAYDIKIVEGWAISPQYSYYLGLSKEFVKFPTAARSMRHYFCIGIQRALPIK